MNRFRISIGLAAVVVVIVGVGIYAFHRQASLRAEQALYHDLIAAQPNELLKAWDDIAYVSAPVVCAAPPEMPDGSRLQQLYLAYLRANRQQVKPVSLRSLEGRAPVVKLESAQRIHRVGGLRFYDGGDISLIGLSRVGFGRSLADALICIHSERFPHFRGTLILVEIRNHQWQISTYWKTDVDPEAL